MKGSPRQLAQRQLARSIFPGSRFKRERPLATFQMRIFASGTHLQTKLGDIAPWYDNTIVALPPYMENCSTQKPISFYFVLLCSCRFWETNCEIYFPISKSCILTYNERGVGLIYKRRSKWPQVLLRRCIPRVRTTV